MSLMDTILRRKPVEAVAMISKVEHDRIVAATRQMGDLWLAEAQRLKPDALKYRERCRRDREAAAAKRKAKGGEG